MKGMANMDSQYFSFYSLELTLHNLIAFKLWQLLCLMQSFWNLKYPPIRAGKIISGNGKASLVINEMKALAEMSATSIFEVKFRMPSESIWCG